MMGAGKASAPSDGRGAAKLVSDAPLDRVLHALNHPIRRQILRVLVDECVTASASTLARKLKLELGTASYHLNQVLAKQCGVVELVDSVPRRGAIEKVYSLKFRSRARGKAHREGAAEAGPRALSLEECFILVAAAVDADGLEPPVGCTSSWFLAPVDAEGWGEIRKAGADFDQRARAAVEASRGRTGASEARDVVVGVAAFPANPTPPSGS